MSGEDFAPSRFVGRTYSRKSKSAEAPAVKAAVSLSKWGKANYVPYREEAGGDAKIWKTETSASEEDPFRFDIEDKSKKSPVKRNQVGESSGSGSTMLPASRIVTSGKDEKVFKNEIEKVKRESSFRTYSRNTLNLKTESDDQEHDAFMKVGETVINTEGDRIFIPYKEPDDDDIFPVEFKRDPLKTYAGEVVTPVDKPESPPPKKGRYVKKGGQRGRKPLTVSDPDLIEQYKRNYEAQQQRGSTDSDTGGLNNSMVVSKQELTNEDKGKVVVVVCKPKHQVEKGDVQSKYFTRTPRKVGLSLVDFRPDSASSSQNTDNNATPEGHISTPDGNTPTRVRIQRGVVATSNSNTSSPATAANITKRITRGKLSAINIASPAGSTTSTDSLSQGEGSGGRNTGKRYRIFKTRAQPGDFEPEATTTLSLEAVAQEESGDIESPFPADTQSQSQTFSDSQEILTGEAIGSQQPAVILISDVIGNQIQVQSQVSEEPNGEYGEDIFDALRETPEKVIQAQPEHSVGNGNGDVEQTTTTEAMEVDQAPGSQTLMTCVKNLASRLKEGEKGNDSDSTEHDNVSECSEILLSQESPANSQSTVEDKEETVAPRRFFKSKKSLSNSSDLKRKLLGVGASPQKSPAKASYNARSWQNDDEDGGDSLLSLEGRRRLGGHNKEDMVLVRDSSKAPRLSREVHWPERKYDEAYTSLKVNKKHKELYTVVHNVKQTHEVQEMGETQDFIDDVNYLLDSLQSSNSNSIRCLSCLKLAGKCIQPAFRMHLRAHGTVTKIFSLLHDACSDACLALSTSAMMFMLSRDRLNMDLDKDSLNLMLKLNEVDNADKKQVSHATIRELEKFKEKVKELLGQLQQETHAREIDLGFVSTGNLAMESLLSLTSRRAGEWFKEELRSVGGLDHIVDSVAFSEGMLAEDMENDIHNALPSLRKLDRCLRVLENVSFMNTENKVHMLNYKNGALLTSCGRTLRLCQKCMPSFKVLESVEENKAVKEMPGFTVFTSMMAVFRLLLNITHDHSKAFSSFDKSKEKDLIKTSLLCLINTQWCIPMEQRFDLSVLCLGLLINLVEGNEANRTSFMEISLIVKETENATARRMSAVKAVINLFCQREKAAREMEENSDGGSGAADISINSTSSQNNSPNKSGEWKETDVGIQWITNNLKKAKEEEEKLNSTASNDMGVGGNADTSMTGAGGADATSTGGDGNQSILEDDEETFTKALHKAGKHMENSIVASYAGLLLGSLVMDNEEYITTVKTNIPNQDFKPMIKTLKKFLNFMSLTTAFGSTDVNGITKVIEVLESA